MAIVRAIQTNDRGQWGTLYAGYAAFYGMPQDETMRERVFGWLMEEGGEMDGLVAEADDGTLVGMAHLRLFKRPLAAKLGLFLDDLYIDPSLRGSGLSRQMYAAMDQMAADKGCDLIRWITADDNYRARGLYDQLADRTGWITYDRRL